MHIHVCNSISTCLMGPDSTHIIIMFNLQHRWSLDDRIAWSYFEFPKKLLTNEETVEQWINLNGKQGDGHEGTIHIVLSFTVRIFLTQNYHSAMHIFNSRLYLASFPGHYRSVFFLQEWPGNEASLY